MTSATQHIAQEMLLRYVEDDCSRLEMREIDRHLATCPMCSDAVEGLMLLSEPSVAVAHLNQRIDARVAEIGVDKPTEKPIQQPVLKVVETGVEQPIFEVVKRPFWQKRWAAAAAVLVLATGSILIYTNTQKTDKQEIVSSEITVLPNLDTAKNDNETPQYATAEKTLRDNNLPQNTPTLEGNINTTSTSVADLASEDVNTQLKDKFERGLPPDSDIKKVPKQSAEDEKAATTDSKIAETTTAKPTPSYGNIPQSDRTRDYSGAANMNSVPRPTTATETPSKYESVKKYEDKMADVSQSESKENIQDVVVMGTTKAKKQVPSSPYKPQTTPSVSNASDAILSRADAYFKQKNYEKAVAEYTQFMTAETSGDRYERALFQTASAYVQLNRKAEAKAIFEKLVAMNGQFGRAAKKALKDL